ncbi:MAG: hypothetical protein ACRC1P_02850 [Cellulosilyticaceae bacterium]
MNPLQGDVKNNKVVEILKCKLHDQSIMTRMIWCTFIFLIVFFSVTIISYFVLPQGFLLSKNRMADFETSNTFWICTMQIFGYNMMSILLILIGSLVAKKKANEECYISYGYIGFVIYITLNAITLGTWSFTVNTNSVPLIGRLLRTFDIMHNAGLLEMYGQLLITCGLANKYLLLTDGKNTITRSVRELKFCRSEAIVLVIGLLLMLIGAGIESWGIISINLK